MDGEALERRAGRTVLNGEGDAGEPITWGINMKTRIKTTVFEKPSCLPERWMTWRMDRDLKVVSSDPG